MTATRAERARQSLRIIVGDSYLTQREYQCVAMYADGVRPSQMPKKMACARKTIDALIQRAKERLAANSIHHLVAIVARADAIRQTPQAEARGATVGKLS